MLTALRHKCCLIDLDGTMYRGDEPIAGAREFIEALQQEGIPFYFLTNNAMRTHAQNKAKMESFGFTNLRKEQFFTSAMAAASYIRHHTTYRRAYCIGEAGLKEALLEQDFLLCDDEVEVVFAGLDAKVSYERLNRAFYHMQNNALLVGTNPDRRLPHKDHFWIGNGAFVALLEYCSEQSALMIGKPQAPMMEEVLRYVHKTKADCVMIGDNLDTDVAFGIQQGVDTIFVATGVHTMQDCQEKGMHPWRCVEHLSDLLE